MLSSKTGRSLNMAAHKPPKSSKARAAYDKAKRPGQNAKS